MKVIEWTGKCQRCFEETSTHIMSMYSTRLICMACKDKEAQQDDYQSAVNADNAAIKSGNFNFKGIGEK